MSISLACPGIPIINLGLQERRKIISALKHACEEVGFFYVINHGISPRVINKMVETSTQFFALPQDVKLTIAKNKFNPLNANKQRGYIPVQGNSSSIKEGLDLGDEDQLKPDMEQNLWLHEEDKHLPGFKANVMRYFKEVERLENHLIELIAEALGGDQNSWKVLFHDSVSSLRLIRYPKPKIDSAQDRQGLDWEGDSPVMCSSHTDSGLITILFQDNVEGLQILNGENQWIDAPTIPNSFDVNLGDVLRFWSGSQFLATKHRVLRSPTERMSIPFFVEPSEKASLTSLVKDQSVKKFIMNGRKVSELSYKEYPDIKIKQFIEFS